MKDINLLPKKYLSELKWNRFSCEIIAFVAIIFLFAIFITFQISVKNAELEREIVLLSQNALADKYVLTDRLAADYEDLTDQLNHTALILSELQHEQLIVYEKINTIFNALPESIKIYEITINNQSKRANLTGISNNRENIASYSDFITRTFSFANITSLITLLDGKTRFTLEWNFAYD